VARSAEQLGFHAALTPTSSWCEDAWILTAGLTQTTERLRFLVAFRPGLQSPARYARTGEFLHIVRELWSGQPVDFHGEHYHVEDAQLYAQPRWPSVYFGGSSPEAIEVAGRHADVYLTWGEPPDQVAEKLDRVRAAAAGYGRELRFGIRLHVIARATPRPRPGRRRSASWRVSSRRRSSGLRPSSGPRSPRASAG
jgi:alkanesulfonate monooxygenase